MKKWSLGVGLKVSFGMSHVTWSQAGCGRLWFGVSLIWVQVLAGQGWFSFPWPVGAVFGFVLNTGVIIRRCFCHCWAGLARSQGLSASPRPTGEEFGVQGTQPGLTKGHSGPRDICSVLTAGGRRGKRGHLEFWCLSSRVTITQGRVLLSWAWLNACPAMGSRDSFLALLSLQAHFAFPVKLPLSQPMRFLAFTLPIPSPIPLLGQGAGAV